MPQRDYDIMLELYYEHKLDEKERAIVESRLLSSSDYSAKLADLSLVREALRTFEEQELPHGLHAKIIKSVEAAHREPSLAVATVGKEAYASTRDAERKVLYGETVSATRSWHLNPWYGRAALAIACSLLIFIGQKALMSNLPKSNAEAPAGEAIAMLSTPQASLPIAPEAITAAATELYITSVAKDEEDVEDASEMVSADWQNAAEEPEYIGEDADYEDAGFQGELTTRPFVTLSLPDPAEPEEAVVDNNTPEHDTQIYTGPENFFTSGVVQQDSSPFAGAELREVSSDESYPKSYAVFGLAGADETYSLAMGTDSLAEIEAEVITGEGNYNTSLVHPTPYNMSHDLSDAISNSRNARAAMWRITALDVDMATVVETSSAFGYVAEIINDHVTVWGSMESLNALLAALNVSEEPKWSDTDAPLRWRSVLTEAGSKWYALIIVVTG